jgi:hypothetical protein
MRISIYHMITKGHTVASSQQGTPPLWQGLRKSFSIRPMRKPLAVGAGLPPPFGDKRKPTLDILK